MQIETKIETVDGKEAAGKITLEIEHGAAEAPLPGDQPETVDTPASLVGDGTFILPDLPEHPKGQPDPTDIGIAGHYGKWYWHRIGAAGRSSSVPTDPPDEEDVSVTSPEDDAEIEDDSDFPEPVFNAPNIVVKDGPAGVFITDYGAKGRDYNEDTKAFERAAKEVRNGGVVRIPEGSFKIAEADLPHNKDFIIRGEGMKATQLVSAPGKDVLRCRTWGAQARMKNMHQYEQMSIYLRSKSASHDHSREFKRRTIGGWPVAHAGIAYVQTKFSDKSAERKHNWANSYVIIDKVHFHGDKNSNGPTAVYADNCIYGMKIPFMLIGDHGSKVGGVAGGVILGKPPMGISGEYSPDELNIGVFTHFNPVVSISLANTANSVIDHAVIYACKRTALEIAGLDSGVRKRSRDVLLGQIYIDNDAAPVRSDKYPLVNIDSDFCRMHLMHLKGSRKSHGATHRPLIKMNGSRLKGDVTVMSSSGHFSPRFQIGGKHHDLTISAGGVRGKERETLINGKSSYAGIKVI